MRGLPAVLQKTVSFVDETGKYREVLAGCYIEVFTIQMGSTYFDANGKMYVQREDTYAGKFNNEMFDIARDEFSVVI